MPKKVSIKIPECGHGNIVTTVDGSPWVSIRVTPQAVAKTAGSAVKAGKKMSCGGAPIVEVFNCEACVAAGKPSGTRPYVPPEGGRRQIDFGPKSTPEASYYRRPPVSERAPRPHYLHRP